MMKIDVSHRPFGGRFSALCNRYQIPLLGHLPAAYMMILSRYVGIGTEKVSKIESSFGYLILQVVMFTVPL